MQLAQERCGQRGLMLAAQPFPVGLPWSPLSGRILPALAQPPRGIQRVPSCKSRTDSLSGVGGPCSAAPARSGREAAAAGEGAELGVVKAHVSLMRAPARAP